MNDTVAATPEFIHYVMETQYAGIDARVLVNGVELIHASPADRKITSEKINGWLIGGDNTIQIDAAVRDPAQVVEPIQLKCLLFRGPAGRQPEEREALLRFAAEKKTDLPQGKMQKVWQGAFKPEPAPGPWLWESALPIVEGEATTEAVLAVVRQVIVALNAHDGAEVVKLFRVYTDEIARAYNYNPARQEAQLAALAQSWTAVQPRPLMAKDYVMHIEENRRLLRLERTDGMALFTVDVKAGSTGPKRLYMAPLPTGWAIVR